MELAAQLLIASVLASGELCTQPMTDGSDGPYLCHLYSAQKIETPYFSIDIEPDFLVGIDRHLTETYEEDVTWRDCHRASETVFERQLVARLKNGYVVIHYSYAAGIGTKKAPSLERMTQSIRIHAI